MKVLAKLRRGVLEIAAGDECRYVEPSFLQRAYLVWTFRNFRRLPVRVLNQRQREIVERLSHFAEIREPKRSDSALVIGRAEFPAFPVRKTLIVESAPSRAKMRHPAVAVGMGPSSAHRLSNLRVIIQHAAKTIATSSRGTQSHARYSLILTLAAASLIVISGAVAQRLWISRAKSTSSTTASAPSPKTVAMNAIHTAPATHPIPAARPAPTQPAKPTPTKPLASTATQPPVQVALVIPASDSQGVTSAPRPVESREAASAAEAKNETPRLRVFLTPQSIIYPSIPVSAASPDQKKEILVKAVVNANGLVNDVEVPGQTPSLASAIARTVKQWRYQPYVVNGQSVEVETRMIFTVLGPDAITVRFLPPGENPAKD